MSRCECLNVEQIKEVLKSNDQMIRSLAEELYKQKSILVMGRGYNYATCLEGALVSSYAIKFVLIWNLCIFKLCHVVAGQM